jgi:peptide methionine sulfoxide reductase MsrA
VGTRTGYAGGSLSNPSYHRIGDHVEAVEVTFDTRRISYEELLAVFWSSHPAGLEPGPTRAATGIFYRGPEQRRAAEASRRRVAAATGEVVHSRVAPLRRFWPAEPRHQKFTLRRLAPRLVAEETSRDPGFLSSTAAARLNGWLQGFGGDAGLAAAARELETTPAELERRLDRKRPGGR